MPFTDAKIDDVKDKLDEIQEARAKIRLAKMSIGEGRTGELTNQEAEAVRDRLRARIQQLRTQIVAEVATWN